MTSSIPRAINRLLLCTALISITASCTALGLEGATSGRAQLVRHRDRWVRQQVVDYRFTYDVTCLCEATDDPIEIEVRGSLLASAAYADTDQPVPGSLQASLPTIDDLFTMIEQAIDQRVHLIEVSYHPTMGYPTRISIDNSFNVAADEVVHVVRELVPITP